ncbi:hypothetical protein [Lysobacter capsici]|uniref:hypothetical protein n=1 Tax=Lysobacter capsici TaxID=435897 RepID=UPI0004496A09|nr:hypothetical protein [Lysobacter capsici]
MPKAIEVLQRYAKVLSAVQRRKIARIIGEVVDAATPAKAPRAKKQGRKLGPLRAYALRLLIRGFDGGW